MRAKLRHCRGGASGRIACEFFKSTRSRSSASPATPRPSCSMPTARAMRMIADRARIRPRRSRFRERRRRARPRRPAALLQCAQGGTVRRARDHRGPCGAAGPRPARRGSDSPGLRHRRGRSPRSRRPGAAGTGRSSNSGRRCPNWTTRCRSRRRLRVAEALSSRRRPARGHARAHRAQRQHPAARADRRCARAGLLAPNADTLIPSARNSEPTGSSSLQSTVVRGRERAHHRVPDVLSGARHSRKIRRAAMLTSCSPPTCSRSVSSAGRPRGSSGSRVAT